MEQPTGPISAIKLVRDFFHPEMQEMRTLPVDDRNQLASAIARQQGLTQADVSFPLVDY